MLPLPWPELRHAGPASKNDRGYAKVRWNRVKSPTMSQKTAARVKPEEDEAAFGPGDAEAGGLLTIDLGALAANYRDLAARAKPAECAAVVKADAYGIGLEPAAAALAKAGCKTFFVALLDEALKLRTVTPDAAIYVLN